LDLDPTPAAREVYLVPYGKDCQLIIAPGGWLTLFGRAGWSISYGVVYDNELDNFRVTLGSDPRIDFTPQPRKQGQIIWAYAVASRAGYKDVVKVIGPDEIEHAKKFAKSLNVWKEHPARMAEKTVLKLLAKSLPKLGDAPVLQQAAYIQDVYESREKRVRDVRTEFGDAAVEAVGAEIVEVEAALEPVDTLDAAYAQIDAAQTPEAVRAVLTAHPQHADDVQLKIYATKRIDALKGAQK
jgi:recombinational DNA repair protein RecT